MTAMNAHTPIALPERQNAWYSKSGIMPCSTCDGVGGEMTKPFGHSNDPDNYLIECQDCDGEGHHACEVCGNTVSVSGFDCLACDMVLELPASDLNATTAAELAKAVVRAVEAAAKHRASVRECAA